MNVVETAVASTWVHLSAVELSLIYMYWPAGKPARCAGDGGPRSRTAAVARSEPMCALRGAHRDRRPRAAHERGTACRAPQRRPHRGTLPRAARNAGLPGCDQARLRGRSVDA